MSTSGASEAQRELAVRNKDSVDRAVAALMLLLLLLRRNLGQARDETQAALRIAAFSAQLELLISRQTELLDTEMRQALELLFGIAGTQTVDFNRVFPAGRILASRITTQLAQSQDEARLGAYQTGQPYPQVLAGLTGAPAFVSSIKRKADTAFSFIAQGSLYATGSGQAQRKIAVPVLDERTTALCRNRMAYQVRDWEAYFEDPLTGARWLFPPFINGGLPSREAFHFCRTTIAPVI